MSKQVYKYGKMVGLLRHCETSDIEVYEPSGDYLGRVRIEAESPEKQEKIRQIVRAWNDGFPFLYRQSHRVRRFKRHYER